MSAADGIWRIAGDAILIRVRLTPKGGRDAVDGIVTTADGPAIKARVRAAPEDGEANAALSTLLAGWLGVPKRNVSIAGGHKSRTKLFAVTGNTGDLEACLSKAIAALPTKA